MIGNQQNNENEALYKFLEVAKEYLAARDALWSLGLFNRIFRFGRCVDLLNQYDEAKENVRSAFQEIQNIITAQAGADIVGEKNTPRNRASLLTVEEFEVLLNKPPILRNRSPLPKDKP